MTEDKKLTGYPSIDKPWLKYYSEEAINASLPKCTMYQYIWENNRDYLSDVALRYYGTKITYGQLFNNIRKAAAAFFAMGVRKGDIVTVMSMHTPETIYAIYALNYIGAVANMVYMTLAEKEILQTLENTESKLFLVLDVALDRVSRIQGSISMPVVVLGVADSMPPHIKLGYRLKAKPKKHDFLSWKGFIAKAGASAPMATDHTAPSVIVYTSGTTGEPKGVVLSSDSLNAVAAQLIVSGKNYQRGETFFDNIPPFFGFGISMAHLGIYCGIEIILWLQLKPEEIAKGIAKEKPNRYAGGPPVVDPIMRLIHGDMSFLIEFTGGGDSLSPDKEKEINLFLKEHGSSAKYTTGYGMSEVISVVCAQQNHLYREGSIGIPLPKTNLKIVDPESQKELSLGETGEIIVSTPTMMVEYYRNPKETKKNNQFGQKRRSVVKYR